MAALDDETAAKVQRIMKRARLKHRDIPRLIRGIGADIRVKRQAKDMAAPVDPAETGMLLTLSTGSEKLARLFLKKKVYPEIKGPCIKLVRAPDLKPGISGAAYVLLAVAVRVFLFRYFRLHASLARFVAREPMP